jgi:hypothetical protein
MLVADTLVVIGLATVSLGTIQEADGPKEHIFWLRNAGRHTVALTQGYTSCGCTTIHFDKARQMKPGDSTTVILRFNPRGKGGEFEEVGTVVYQKTTDKRLQTTDKGLQTTDNKSEVNNQKKVSMSLVGTCITSEETLLRQFPIRINDRLRLSTNRFDLGIMHVGESKERTVVVLHRNDNCQERIPIRFTVDAKTPKGLQHIAHPVKVGKETVNITLDVLIK